MISELIRPFALTAQFAFEDFCASCSGQQAYADLLSQTFYYVRETVPIMRAIATAQPNHPLAKELLAHSEEEAGHDEILLQDLRVIGCRPSREVSPSVKSLVELEHQTLTRADPISALLGHMLVMEGYPPTLRDVEKLVARFQVPLQAARAFLVHARLDAVHGPSVLALTKHPSVCSELLLEHARLSCHHLRHHWIWMKGRHNHVH